MNDIQKQLAEALEQAENWLDPHALNYVGNEAREALDAYRQKDPIKVPQELTNFQHWLNRHRDLRVAEVFHDVVAKYESALAAPRTEQPKRALTDEQSESLNDMRISLVVAIHSLASNFENCMYALDEEARRSSQASIQHARQVAAQWNYNGALKLGIKGE